MKHCVYFDFIKGGAIMGVIAIHTLKFNFDPISVTGLLVVVVRNLLGCCVPLFVAASGYFLWKKNFHTKIEYLRFLTSRLRIVYIPMLLWGLPWFLLSLKGANMVGTTYNTILYFAGGLSIFYFITLIFECYIILPVVKEIRFAGVILLSVMSIIITFVWTIVNHTTDLHLPLIVYCSLPTYIGYFALGCYLGRTEIKPNCWIVCIITILGLIGAVAETYYWFTYHGENNGLGLKSSVSFFSFGVILLVFSKQFSGKYKSTRFTKWIEWCGVQSMPIYLSHMLILFIMNVLGIQLVTWFSNWLLLFSLDVFLIYVMYRMLPKKVLSYLGIR